jgi:hypothetical protein
MTKQKQVQDRHGEYFLHVLYAINETYLKGGESVADALRAFDSHWLQIEHDIA